MPRAIAVRPENLPNVLTFGRRSEVTIHHPAAVDRRRVDPAVVIVEA
jgi:hypothetical protein